MNYHAECWFPCMVHIVDTEPDEKIKSYCLKLREQNPETNYVSNRRGWQSHSFECTETGTIKSAHYTDLNPDGVINRKLYELFEPTINTNIDGKVRIYNYWININGKGAYNVEHDHPQAHFSGVYYVNCPKDSGVIVFENPFNFKAFDELSSYNEEFVQKNAQHKSIYIEPKDGLLIIFPAHLRHLVPENNTDEERISIGFNLHVSPYQQWQYY
tara:strand:+ start:1033 stop:1674 length:642 start_codon:yes stop_codon:yes gene_type:complete